jgi:REP element-mobilizing transposase RayT
MVLGNHVIFGTYGFWLPNDPRGSWSDFVGSWELFRYGSATKTTETRSVAARGHDVSLRLAAKRSLKYPSVQFNGTQALAVSRGFSDYAVRSGLTIWACAILPDHVHLVLCRHRLDAEQLVIQLKGAATRRLMSEGLHPFRQFARNDRPPKCFGRGEWKVFLDSDDDLCRAIRYVEDNPIKEGKKAQRWSFVTAFREATRSAPKTPRRG